MINWLNLYEENDLTYISRTGRIDEYAGRAFSILQDELIDYFGVSDHFLKLLKNKVKIALLEGDIALTGDRTKLIFIDKLNDKNKDLEAMNTKGDIYEAVISIEKNLGFKLDSAKLTVFEFYKYTKFIKSHGAK